jgi:hypothetical protein
MSDIDTLIGPALRERMRSEHLDLEHLAGASLRAGLRLRRRRRVATVAGGTAAVAVVGVGVAVAQGGGGTTASDPDVATSTSPEPTATATVTEAGASVTAPASGPTLPVTLEAPGWSCESYPVDEKMWCTKGAQGISVVVRDGAEHDAWAGDPDKGGSSMWTSPVHGNYFVSIQGGPEPLPPAELDAVIDGLRFAGSWQRP